MRSVIKKWGNSASVRIPSSIMEAAHLDIDDLIEIREEDGRIVIDRIHDDEYDLSQLLSAIEPDNIHREFDFGTPSGRELL